ncbi:MAG: YciI family protein [Ginsengibacter sp.]
MKGIFIFLTLLGLAIAANAQSTNKAYDSVLAKKLKADDYGMKNYVLVLLKSGSNTSTDKTLRDSLFAGHMENIGRLAEEGNLVIAGPFGKNDKYRGLFVLNTASFDEAKKMLETDPAIKNKFLEPELYPWYGSAALQETPGIHNKIQKLEF